MYVIIESIMILPLYTQYTSIKVGNVHFQAMDGFCSRNSLHMNIPARITISKHVSASGSIIFMLSTGYRQNKYTKSRFGGL